ncbi:fimbrial protein [Serratia marcescens]|uniref:fimbrial protein n=1 Tax=Serratia TaxID=613 RepID=UPI000C13B288|nr:fimbrial protein [Serratia marcescens]PHY73473.1 fimbrial protein [Serratia marcescens]PIC08954.1 fimbrial protein [Serratia marcescens]CAI2146002.1 Fimbria A protein precursor [Serratia marcescens]HAT2878024.1 type 1 fimbrial protein [Serratia marcescens]HAT2889347.1 type 1 fimbrial protein [Serratia marcescens]
MQDTNNRLGSLDWQYYLTLAALALMIPLSAIASLWLLPEARGQAPGGHYVDGSNGVLYVRGALTESACRLEMSSARQDIRLGDVATGQLQRVGDRGAPVGFELRLQDCLRSAVGGRDNRGGAWVWAPQQPVVTVSFSAPADADNPQLVKVLGASGLGLRLLDAAGRDVRLGSRGRPLLLTPGQNSLRYTVMAERTAASLLAGSYHAVVDFYLTYD